MRLISLLLLVATGACATVQHTTAPGSSPGTITHRVDEFSFEVIGNEWRQGKGSDLSLDYCSTDPATKTCVLLAVWLRDDFESDCQDGAAVGDRIFQGRKGSPEGVAVTVAGRPSWRFSRPADHVLVVCNGKRSWMVRTRAFGANQDRFATLAFETILATAKIDPTWMPKQ